MSNIIRARDFKTITDYADDRMVDKDYNTTQIIIDLWNDIQALKQDVASLNELLNDVMKGEI